MFLFPKAADTHSRNGEKIFINRISLKNVAGVRERSPLSERRRGEERTRERLGSASAFKVLGAEGGCRPLRDRRGTKTPERGGCCINIYTGKEGLPCWKLEGMRRESWRGTK